MTYQQQPYADANQPGYGQQPSPGEPPVGEPYFGVGFGRAFKRFWRGYVVFSGRASRAEFWWAYLWLNIIIFALAMIYMIGALISMFSTVAGVNEEQLNDPAFGIRISLSVLGWAAPMFLFSLASVLPTYSIMWRRLHDAGFHGAFALLSLAGLSIVPLIMCILPTSADAVRYGPGAVPGVPGQPGGYGYPGQYPQGTTPPAGPIHQRY